ncbi:Flp family type IVb pilin [Consotaella aegiceratis]|uniref:Flp family type IVb pilin n=1 Tax=Consotaella aegiceratis TaxID=3097961 RepID=UPI002F42AEFE
MKRLDPIVPLSPGIGPGHLVFRGQEGNFMINLLRRFKKNESGATAIEYGLIAGLVAVAIITALTTMGGKLDATFNKISDELQDVATS